MRTARADYRCFVGLPVEIQGVYRSGREASVLI